MLQITIPAYEGFDPETNCFFNIKEQTLNLEHSLLSISKWESQWNKPFFNKEQKTKEELRDYVKCMTVNQNISQDVYFGLTEKNYEDILKYIEAPMTATTFNENKQSPSREIITSEIIYYWMITYNIPFECQKWHINKLLTLIKVCGIKGGGDKKMSKNEILNSNRELNNIRRAAMKTRG